MRKLVPHDALVTSLDREGSQSAPLILRGAVQPFVLDIVLKCHETIEETLTHC